MAGASGDSGIQGLDKLSATETFEQDCPAPSDPEYSRAHRYWREVSASVATPDFCGRSRSCHSHRPAPKERAPAYGAGAAIEQQRTTAYKGDVDAYTVAVADNEVFTFSFQPLRL